jgi:transketolase N-terminal domain/subunit
MATLGFAQAGVGGTVSTNTAASLVPSAATENSSETGTLPEGSFGSGMGMSDASQAREAVERFRYYFELQNADLLRGEIWPSMSPKAYRQMKNTFAVLSQVSLQENCAGAPVVISDSAEWTCSERFGYEFDGRPGDTQTHTLQFHLKKVDGKWYVEQRTRVSR